MKLRDRWWCWRHDVCPKHMLKKNWGITGTYCNECYDEAKQNYRDRLKRLKKENQ